MPLTPFEVIGLSIAAAIMIGVVVWALRPDKPVKTSDRTPAQPIFEGPATEAVFSAAATDLTSPEWTSESLTGDRSAGAFLPGEGPSSQPKEKPAQKVHKGPTTPDSQPSPPTIYDRTENWTIELTDECLRRFQIGVSKKTSQSCR